MFFTSAASGEFDLDLLSIDLMLSLFLLRLPATGVLGGEEVGVGIGVHPLGVLGTEAWRLPGAGVTTLGVPIGVITLGDCGTLGECGTLGDCGTEDGACDRGCCLGTAARLATLPSVSWSIGVFRKWSWILV